MYLLLDCGLCSPSQTRQMDIISSFYTKTQSICGNLPHQQPVGIYKSTLQNGDLVFL